jgi:hypothetical protein
VLFITTGVFLDDTLRAAEKGKFVGSRLCDSELNIHRFSGMGQWLFGDTVAFRKASSFVR